MLKVANIWPVANQNHYKDEDVVMILAHIVKQGLYNPSNFNEKQYIIMDNGLFEKSQVSTSLKDCIDIAVESEIDVDEIIIPDAANDSKATVKLFEDNLETVRAYQDVYNFMFVAQAKTYEELSYMIDYANAFYGSVKLTIGISKLTPLARDSNKALEIYSKCKFPIHFLGIKTTFSELLPVRNIIRSCDTSQLAFMAKNNVSLEDLDLVHYARKGIDIDLVKDNCNNRRLCELARKQEEDFTAYGLL